VHLEFSPHVALNCLEEQGVLYKKVIKAQLEQYIIHVEIS